MTKPRSELKTRPLTNRPTQTLTTIHVLTHLRWDREGYESFEVQRARLLNILSDLQKQMGSNNEHPIKSYLMGGQTVILEDIAGIRPELVTMLVVYNAGGRVGIGPWYIIVDEALVTGEALIRNLLTARADAARHGLRLIPIAYIPDVTGHTAQLPQILQSFDIDGALLRHGAPIVHVPFRWEAPNGKSILIINHEAQAHWPREAKNIFAIAESIQAQRTVRPDGPFLWLFDSVNASRPLPDAAPKVAAQTALPIKQSDLLDYVRALRSELPDEMRPALNGELRLQSLREDTFLHPGTLSTRLHLKQANARLQARLLRAVEPWLAIAISHGQLDYPDNYRALLDHCWRLLLKNQAKNTLAGTISDAVEAECEGRSQRVQDASSEIIRQVLGALSGQVHLAGQAVAGDQTYIVVWNSLNWPITQMVEMKLDLPPGKYPVRVLSPEGAEQVFSWQPDAKVIGFFATPPGIGYTAYTIELGAEPPSERHHIHLNPGVIISKSNGGETFTVTDGRLVWRKGDFTADDVLRFVDGGDAGDAYNYSPPQPDFVVEADLIDDVKVETSPLYERLIIRHRMRVAPELKEDRSRERGVKLIELTTTATFYEEIDGLHLRTTFTNTAKDHRLRAHIRTSVMSDRVLADSAFYVVERPVKLDGAVFPDQPCLEGVINTQPLQSVVVVPGPKQTVALAVRGLPEYEAIEERQQITLALTLVRAVGSLSRDDLKTRTVQVTPMLEIPGAQCLRDMEADYMLRLLPQDDSAAVVRMGEEFNTPLQAYQYDALPERPERSFLSVVSDKAIGEFSDGEGAIVTAIKPLHKGEGWIVRLFNPHDHPVEVLLTPFKRAELTQIVMMSELPQGFIETDANGRVALYLNAHEIVSVRFLFKPL